jgi:hypothetical protein
MLQEETKYFSDNIGKLLDRYPGKLVLIKGSRLVAVFENQQAALNEGTRMFGLEPFSIRRVEADGVELCTRASEKFGELKESRQPCGATEGRSPRHATG